jgi:hypothetical protein
MFGENRIPYSNVQKLIQMWQTTGVQTLSGIVCKECCTSNTSQPSEPNKNRRIKKVDSQIAVVEPLPEPSQANLHYLIDTSFLTFKQSPPPLHLYFHLDVTTTSDVPSRQDFVDSTNWPFHLSVGGSTYTLFARGYYSGNHYWCKVLRSAVGTIGIWLHNNAENDGYACLISHIPSSIAGPSPSTSWLMYLHSCNPSDKEYVDTAIKKISSDNHNAPGQKPFIHLKSLLTISGDSINDKIAVLPAALKGNPPDAKYADDEDDGHQDALLGNADDSGQFMVLETDFADLEDEERRIADLSAVEEGVGEQIELIKASQSEAVPPINQHKPTKQSKAKKTSKKSLKAQEEPKPTRRFKPIKLVKSEVEPEKEQTVSTEPEKVETVVKEEQKENNPIPRTSTGSIPQPDKDSIPPTEQVKLKLRLKIINPLKPNIQATELKPPSQDSNRLDFELPKHPPLQRSSRQK